MKTFITIGLSLILSTTAFAKETSIKKIIRSTSDSAQYRALSNLSFREINQPANIKYLGKLFRSGRDSAYEALLPLCTTINRMISDSNTELKNTIFKSLAATRGSYEKQNQTLRCVGKRLAKPESFIRLLKRSVKSGDQFLGRNFLEKLNRNDVTNELANDLGSIVLKNKRKHLTISMLETMSMARGFDVTPYYLHVVKYSSKNDRSAVLSGLQFLTRYGLDVPLSMIGDLVDILRYKDSQMIGLAMKLIKTTLRKNLGMGTSISKVHECFPQGNHKEHSEGVKTISTMLDLMFVSGGSMAFSRSASAGYIEYKALTRSQRRKLKRTIQKIIQGAQKSNRE